MTIFFLLIFFFLHIYIFLPRLGEVGGALVQDMEERYEGGTPEAVVLVRVSPRVVRLFLAEAQTPEKKKVSYGFFSCSLTALLLHDRYEYSTWCCFYRG